MYFDRSAAAHINGSSGPASWEPFAANGRRTARKSHFVVLVHPNMALLDFVSAQAILRLTQGEVHLAWKRLEPVMTDLKVAVMPTTTFAECPRGPNVLFVPGTASDVDPCLKDKDVLRFLAACGARAKYVTSTSSGAGLLRASGVVSGGRKRGRCSRFLLMAVRPKDDTPCWCNGARERG
jgi:cyclohexyl-isocyanide hydratase